jgi:phage FluMu protein Com
MKLRRRKMIKLIKKFFNLFKSNKIIPEVIEKCAVHVTRFKKSCPRCQQLNQLHGQVW